METYRKSRNLMFLFGMRAIALVVVLAMVFGVVGQTDAAITTIPITEFAGATVEKFQSPYVVTSSYDFGNGMTHLNLVGASDHINYTGTFGMVLEPSISSGKDGDGYFGTGPTPTTFQLAFAGGMTKLGFFGAESRVSDGSFGRNGVLDIEFYDLSNVLIDALSVSTLGTFAWDQFHGFLSDTPVSRMVFRDVGHMVLDDVHFVPEPATICLLGLGGLAALRRKRKA